MNEASMKAARPKRRLKNLLVDVRYQLSFALPLVLVAAALLFGLGFFAHQKNVAATTIGLQQLEVVATQFGGELDAVRDELLARRAAIDRGIVLGGAALCLVLLAFGVVLTHRVAGPLLRVRRTLERLREGALDEPPVLRKHDVLVELFTALRGACGALRERQRAELALMRRVVALAEREGTVRPEHLVQLRLRIADKERSLG